MNYLYSPCIYNFGVIMYIYMIWLFLLLFRHTVLMTNCTNVCIDMFCFYSKISCRSHVVKSKTPKVKIDDLSDGRETCPVVLINEISEDLPPHLAYISSRNKAEDVYINIDPGFLVCCDCTDFCQVNVGLFSSGNSFSGGSIGNLSQKLIKQICSYSYF